VSEVSDVHVQTPTTHNAHIHLTAAGQTPRQPYAHPSSAQMLSTTAVVAPCCRCNQHHGRDVTADTAVAHCGALPVVCAGTTSLPVWLPHPRTSQTHTVIITANRSQDGPQHLDTHRHCRDYTTCQWGCSALAALAAQGCPEHPVKQRVTRSRWSTLRAAASSRAGSTAAQTSARHTVHGIPADMADRAQEGAKHPAKHGCMLAAPTVGTFTPGGPHDL
jgi:hypothetical protein